MKRGGSLMIDKVDSLVEFWGDKYLPFSPVGITSVSLSLGEVESSLSTPLGIQGRVSDLFSKSVRDRLGKRYLVWVFYLGDLYEFTFILDDLQTLTAVVTDWSSYEAVYAEEIRFRPSDGDIYLKKHIARILLRYASYDVIVSYFNGLDAFNNGVYKSTKDYMSNLTFNDIYGSCNTGSDSSLETVRLSDIAGSQGFSSLGEFVSTYGKPYCESEGISYSDFYGVLTSKVDWYVIRSKVYPPLSSGGISYSSGDESVPYGVLLGVVDGKYYILSLPSNVTGNEPYTPSLAYFGKVSRSGLQERLADVIMNNVILWDTSKLLEYASAHGDK